jgi:hypothetical protein
MKKSILISLLIMMAFGLKLFAGKDIISYVKAEGKTYLGTDVKIGLTKTKITTLDGTIVKVPNTKIDAYMHKSRLFERLPVVNSDKTVEGLALMEFVNSRSGLRLYRHTAVYDDIDVLANKFESAKAHYDYYVFKDGEFYLLIDKKNAETALPFFGVNVIF